MTKRPAGGKTAASPSRPAPFLAILLLAASPAAASSAPHHRRTAPPSCFAAAPPSRHQSRARRDVVASSYRRDDLDRIRDGDWSYVPPYGNVPRLTVLRSSYGAEPTGGGGGGRRRRRRTDDNGRFAKKVEESRRGDPVVQDFGSADDWQRSKVGTGVKGDGRPGDDGTNERYPARYSGVREDGGGMTFGGGEGGNYWVNGPGGRLDGYPGAPSGGGSPGRRRRRGSRPRDDEEEWRETRPDDGYDLPPPPPTRSRSSFRGGAPPPPRPVKQFYDRLFWFGFDPDVTGPRDRTMFGGTRGKFNAMDMLSDREERQRFRDEGYMAPRGRRRRRREMEEDYYDDEDYDDGLEFEERMRDDPVPPPVADDDDLDFVTPRGQRNRRSRRGRRGRGDERPVDPRAAEYERSLGLDPEVDEGEYPDLDDAPPPSRTRRRAGYAYRLDPTERAELLLLDDGEYIDIDAVDYEPASQARPSDAVPDAGRQRRRRRRSVEDRLLDGERVPPPGAEAWGPGGPMSGTDPLESAALDALSEISRWKDVLARRERDVEDAERRLVRLKAEAARIEDGLEEGRGGRRAREETERELGEALAGAEEAGLALRLARAERDGARDRIDELEERNWAVLSEYEARGAEYDG